MQWPWWKMIHFIVNGDDVFVDINQFIDIKDIAKTALKDSHNTGRPVEDWQIRDNKGYLIEQICDLHENEKYFLSLNMCACYMCKIKEECQKANTNVTEIK